MAENDEAGKLIVEASENEREPKSPKSSLASTIKSWAVLIASLAALATALGAIFKPQDHTVTQTSYEQLSKTMQKIEDQGQANHDDIVSIRQYLADQNKQVVDLPSQAATPPTLRPLVRPPPPTVHTFVKPLPPPPFAEVLTTAAKK